MDANTNITFEQMPQALAEVLSQVRLIKDTVMAARTPREADTEARTGRLRPCMRDHRPRCGLALRSRALRDVVPALCASICPGSEPEGSRPEAAVLYPFSYRQRQQLPVGSQDSQRKAPDERKHHQPQHQQTHPAQNHPQGRDPQRIPPLLKLAHPEQPRRL